MKILMVNKFLYYNGGSESYMIRLGKYLEANGHHIQYFGMSDAKNIVGNEYNAYVPNIDFHSVQGGIKKVKAGLNAIHSKTACSEIRKILESFCPDIVHLNNINFQLTPAIIYEIKRAGIPIVQTVHDVQIACPCHRFYIEHKKQICEQCSGGRYFHCTLHKCLQDSRLKSAIASIESYYYHLRGTYNLIDVYLCPSQFIGEIIKKAGVVKEHVKVLRNFTDQINISDSPTINTKYALYFGRLSQEKGILSLLQICSELPEVFFIIAGKGALESIVQEKVRSLPNVRYIGFKMGTELQSLIAGASFSICPSECYENCPLSVIESQALGTPVIGSDLGGTKELIQHEKTGLIFEGCNKEQLKSAIFRLWHNDLLTAKMSRQCVNIEPMSLKRYTDCLINIYGSLAEGGAQALC